MIASLDLVGRDFAELIAEGGGEEMNRDDDETIVAGIDVDRGRVATLSYNEEVAAWIVGLGVDLRAIDSETTGRLLRHANEVNRMVRLHGPFSFIAGQDVLHFAAHLKDGVSRQDISDLLSALSREINACDAASSTEGDGQPEQHWIRI